jgi:dihydrofolate reductase
LSLTVDVEMPAAWPKLAFLVLIHYTEPHGSVFIEPEKEIQAMRPVILSMNISLDGYVANSDGGLQWAFPRFDAELMSLNASELGETDTILMGRKTYEGMAAHWPNLSDPIARIMNAVEKVVFSRTLKDVSWSGARLAKRSLAEEVASLKRAQGKHIGIAGGATLAQGAIAAKLIDEYRLLTHPVALGQGLPLFVEPLQLERLDSAGLHSGVTITRYQPLASDLH